MIGRPAFPVDASSPVPAAGHVFPIRRQAVDERTSDRRAVIRRREPASPATDDHDRYRHAGLQPRVQARPDHPQPARHRRLQAPHAADDLDGVCRRPGDVLPHQPLVGRASRARDRRKGASRAARSRAYRAAHQEGAHLAGREHLLRQGAPVLSGIPRLARRVQAARIRSSRAGRAAPHRFQRPLGRRHAVGDSGSLDHQRAALASRHEGESGDSSSMSCTRARRRSCGKRWCG